MRPSCAKRACSRIGHCSELCLKLSDRGVTRADASRDGDAIRSVQIDRDSWPRTVVAPRAADRLFRHLRVERDEPASIAAQQRPATGRAPRSIPSPIELRARRSWACPLRLKRSAPRGRRLEVTFFDRRVAYRGFAVRRNATQTRRGRRRQRHRVETCGPRVSARGNHSRGERIDRLIVDGVFFCSGILATHSFAPCFFLGIGACKGLRTRTARRGFSCEDSDASRSARMPNIAQRAAFS